MPCRRRGRARGGARVRWRNPGGGGAGAGLFRCAADLRAARVAGGAGGAAGAGGVRAAAGGGAGSVVRSRAIELRPVEDRIELRGSTGFLLGVYGADAKLEGLQPDVLAGEIKARIIAAIDAYRDGRSAAGVRRALGIAATETVFFAVAVAGLLWLARGASRRLDRHVEAWIGGWEERARKVVRLRTLWQVVRRTLRFALIVLGLIIFYVYLNALLLALPWTRDAGREALAAVVEPLQRLGLDILRAIPKLIALAIIIALTVTILRFVSRFFALVATGSLTLRNFEPEWAVPTARLVRLGVVVLALIMAYPYIPGSSSDAFKAISIFAGIVFSLGSGSVVSNLIAGYSMIYRRAFRVGDRVEIAGVTGIVEALSLQDTHIRTLTNERVTLPNALVLASHVTNFTQLARSHGLILHTEVSIGYEVPWREVEAMLLDAAKRTPGIAATPAPFVRQQKLGDFAPLYGVFVATNDEGAMVASTRRCTRTSRTSSPRRASRS